MRLHFADTSDERGQYALLAHEGVSASLASFHYLRTPGTRRSFEWYWGELVRLHLVANLDANSGMQGRALRALGYEAQLVSYAAPGNERRQREAWDEAVRVHLAGRVNGPVPAGAISAEGAENHLPSFGYREDAERPYSYPAVWRGVAPPAELPPGLPRVIVDSGAFTAWSTGKEIRPEEYAEWAHGFRARWEEKFASLRFINLDVIGDQEGTWRNQETLERLGMSPVPVVTRGADLSHLRRALEGYDYVCLGGLVPLAGSRKAMRAWLDRCFAVVMERYRAGGSRAMPKVHLLGVTQPWALERYPAYSTDSSAWTKPLRFGGAQAAGIKKRLPRYKDGEAQLSATLHALRAEIRRHKKMEADATRLWERRGITFDELR